MSFGHWKTFLLFTGLLAASCGSDGGTSTSRNDASRRLETIKNLHPRILLSSEEQENLRLCLKTTHQWLWKRYLEDLPAKLEQAARPLPEDLNRGHANLAPDLCFAWLMTGEDTHFQAAKNHLLGLARSQEWDPANDLVHGHLLQGIALAYDWLYPSLSAEERSLAAERLGREAEAEYQRMTTGRVWYRNQYFQNHGISNFCGLAYAAVALYGEDSRAKRWLEICEEFFEVVFRTLPRDGTSLEGLSYGAYDFEFITRYAELALGLLGKNHHETEGLKEMPNWFLHSLLPAQTSDEWAMTFGDAPRHANWHGPEPQLFLAASKYGDSMAQWLGKYLINLQEKGLGGASFWAILWYDPDIVTADPAAFATFHHFTENDQVMMRSSWNDPSAMMVGFKCGPFMGKVQSLSAEWDWGTNHQHPDAGSFQVFAGGQFLAIDPLYTTFKRTANHNTMLFKSRGQLGEDIAWMGVAECLHYRHYPEILLARSDKACDYVVGDVTRAYHPALGLKRFVRHLLFIKPDVLIVADQITLEDKGVLYSYPSEELKVEGGLGHSRMGYVIGKQGEAYTIFQGKPGTYRLSANYLDNYPGEGSFSIEVDGKAVHSWKTTSRVYDNHFIISPAVELKPGSRIAFRGSSMPENFRLIKMTAYSEEVACTPAASSSKKLKAGGTDKLPEPGLDVQWLLHCDPEAEIERKDGGTTVTLGEACLDIYTTGVSSLHGLDWDTWTVKEPHEKFDRTKRLTFSPGFDDSEATIVTILRARGKNDPSISNLSSSEENGEVQIAYEIKDKKVVLKWDLEKKEFELLQ